MVPQIPVECSLHSVRSFAHIHAGGVTCVATLHPKKRRKQFKPQMAVLDKRILGCSVAFLNQIEGTSPHMEELSGRTVYLAS